MKTHVHVGGGFVVADVEHARRSITFRANVPRLVDGKRSAVPVVASGETYDLAKAAFVRAVERVERLADKRHAMATAS